MSSHQEQEAGPSGLAHDEMIELLGLETSESEKEEEEETKLLC